MRYSVVKICVPEIFCLQMRAQVNVLKNAMVEEQVTTSELRNTLREREQSLRRAEQEMDSLKFRNQQLTCRIVVLQEELDVQSKPKKGKKAPPAEVHETSSGVLDEELHKKITENAQLVSQVRHGDWITLGLGSKDVCQESLSCFSAS